MSLSAKTVLSQMTLLSPILKSCSLETLRKGQNKIGELMEKKYRHQVIVKEHKFENFKGAWAVPKDERRRGVILYLHGGGYTCGDLEYALGFGSVLAVQSGTRVFCCAYRLAPEHPYPAALCDAMDAYRYLLEKGYRPEQITLCGESAGGGLCYALCLKLKEEGLKNPCGIIAISPWTDLTSSGSSYVENQELDPSMTVEKLDFFAKCYTDDRNHPFVSPLFADLKDMPPSLIFVARNEIMLSDAKDMHEKLLTSGCKSQLIVKADRWHAYVVYGLYEDQSDFSAISKFLNQVMSQENKLRWLRLDNAAKIYPASRSNTWSNVFRLSATLKEEVDVDVLRTALDITVRRFPSIAVRLQSGMFWYYLEQISCAPDIRSDNSYPLARMSKRETGKCAFRVLVHERRVAIEIFHSLTDGNGALIFLKSLVAEYLQQKYGVYVPATEGVLGRLEEPSEDEVEDSFQKYAGKLCASRQENTAWRMKGTPEQGGFLNITCFKLPVHRVLEKAHEYKVSASTFLGAAIMMAVQNSQKQKVPNPNRRKPIKLLIPVNLRKLFPSNTLRNFMLYTTPEILPKLGEYSFEEICQVIQSKLNTDNTPKRMSMLIATNVSSERIMAVRVMPLFIKNWIMKAVFKSVGERKSCLSMSNLGAVKLPKEMTPYVERLDFILGVQATAPYNCGVISFGDTMYVNFIRDIEEADLEYHFHRVLQEMGIVAEVESNQSSK